MPISGVALTLLGLAVGTLMVADRRASPRAEAEQSLRARAIDAQLRAARAAEIARNLTARWSAAAQAKNTKVS